MRLIKSTQNKIEPKLIEASYEDVVIIMTSTQQNKSDTLKGTLIETL